MDWTLITQTMERLDSLSATDSLAEIIALRDLDPQLADAVTLLKGGQENARSFMQTRMPDPLDVSGPSFAQGDRVGAWRIAERIGAGGMGEVYRAERADGLFEQQVALKLAKVKNASLRQRFDAERQRLAQLEHPNIARIVDGGVIDGGAGDGGAPYMTMEFVDGVAIDAYAKANTLDRKARLGLIEKLCGAVAHAHGRLVLHRDIKHDNVLINNDGELRLIDFGVASLVDDTSEEELRGPLTIAYAAPEQLRGEPVSAATDIFAIGMLAHFLEIGTLPQRLPEGGVAIDRTAIGDEDLAAVLGKATAFEPADRYASADALAQDLHKFAGGFPVEARPLSGIARFGKLIARNKPASIMGGAAVAALVAGVIGVSVFAVQANEERERYRIAQLQGAALTEFYETSSLGFASFVARIDPSSTQGSTILEAMKGLEAEADALPDEQSEIAASIYVFLSDFYASAGMITESGVIAQKLADPKIKTNFPTANTLMNAALYASGPEDKKRAIAWIDKASTFFEANSEVHDYEVVMANCIRSRLTGIENDQRACMQSAVSYLDKNDPIIDMEFASTRTIQAYAVDESTRLGELETAERIARDALAGYGEQDILTSVPSAAFWLQLARISILNGDLDDARDSLLSASKSIEEKPEFGFFEVAIAAELANVHNKAGRYSEALDAANRSLQLAQEIYGPENARVATAQAQRAFAQAGLGNLTEAREALAIALAFEEQAGTNAEKISEYRELIRSWQ